MDRFLDPHDTLADKGYQGLDLITPVKKLPGGELTDDEKTEDSGGGDLQRERGTRSRCNLPLPDLVCVYSPHQRAYAVELN